ECYEALRNDKQLSAQSTEGKVNAYVSIPAPDLTNDKLNEDGSLSYDFKYGRNPATEDISTVTVPFSPKYVSDEVLQRLEKLVPRSYELIKETMEQ
ncbi:MAG: hypothetical protein LBH30_03710, partial [Prevotellaceae bacterium]|nr:hypothetical protein [Prevotellaceae bacterium]